MLSDWIAKILLKLANQHKYNPCQQTRDICQEETRQQLFNLLP